MKEETYDLKLTKLELAILKDILEFCTEQEYVQLTELGAEYPTDLEAYESLVDSVKSLAPPVNWRDRNE
jgi:hypothetical protein